MGAACRRDRSEGYDGFKADVWSAGILLYTLTSGLRPFQGRPEDDDKVVMMRATQQRHVDTLFAQLARIGASAELIELLRGMLCIDPSQRLSMLQVRCTSPPPPARTNRKFLHPSAGRSFPTRSVDGAHGSIDPVAVPV